MVPLVLFCAVAWMVLASVLGVLLAAVIGHADRRERAEVARRVAVERSREPVATSPSGSR